MLWDVVLKSKMYQKAFIGRSMPGPAGELSIPQIP